MADETTQIRNLALMSQSDWAGNSGWPVREEPSAWNEDAKRVELRHAQASKDVGPRAFFPEVMGVFKSHQGRPPPFGASQFGAPLSRTDSETTKTLILAKIGLAKVGFGPKHDGQTWTGQKWIGPKWSNEDGQKWIGQKRSQPMDQVALCVLGMSIVGIVEIVRWRFAPKTFH